MMTPDQLKQRILGLLDEIKAKDVLCIDVKEKTSVTDYMIIASGTSSRHLNSIAEHVALETKREGEAALGVEGKGSAEWVLLDHGCVITHIMLPDAREFYDLERLWQPLTPGVSEPASDEEAL
jgi:ribosome-associated protein